MRKMIESCPKLILEYLKFEFVTRINTFFCFYPASVVSFPILILFGFVSACSRN